MSEVAQLGSDETGYDQRPFKEDLIREDASSLSKQIKTAQAKEIEKSIIMKFLTTGEDDSNETSLALLGLNEPTAYESEDQLIIAFDFGTTFSGIAYAFKNDDKPEVVSVDDWPGLPGFRQPKIPTAICYDRLDKTKFSWGAQKHTGDVVQGVKLLLDPGQRRPIYLPDSTAKADILRLGKAPVDVVADFLRAMYDHAISKIEVTVPTAYMTKCQKKFVLSVPALWSDKAKNATQEAAKRAGIFPLIMIKEPEAASLSALISLKDKLAIGDALVICDAGGGTVDLISYEITQLKPCLELKELVPSKGGMAGSLGLNMRFEQAVKQLVGQTQFARLQKTKGYEQAVNQFDKHIKTAFRLEDANEEYHVNFPMGKLRDDPANNLEANCWTMTTRDVRDIFEPLVVDVEGMVEEQVGLVRLKRLSERHEQGKLIKAILLVGGFGSSQYLRSRLAAQHPDIQIIQPHGAWSAIVKGAVLSQLPQEASVVSNQATRHYGIVALNQFDERTDSGQNRTWESESGLWRVRKMTWYINRGEDLMRNQKVRFKFYRALPPNFQGSELIFTIPLLHSNNKSPPVYPSSAATELNCNLVTDLRGVNRNRFPKRVGADGLLYTYVNFDVAITMVSAVMKFSLELDGREMGAVQANYDDGPSSGYRQVTSG